MSNDRRDDTPQFGLPRDSGSTGHSGHSGHTERLVISCDTCVMAHTDACDDCLVTALCGSPSSEAVVFDLEEQRAVRLLTQAGMVPTLRHRAAG